MNIFFMKAYQMVFNERGETRNCGRNACIRLIKMCQELDPETDYGNEGNGYMNIENIKALYKKIVDEQ